MSGIPGLAIAGLVLAGGGARRMGGGDKPLLALGARTMLARIVETLSADLSAGLSAGPCPPAIQCPPALQCPLAISANGDPARFAGFGLPVLGDGAFLGAGPLAGLLAGLDWAASLGCGALLTVPGDTPFIPRGLPKILAPAPSCVLEAGRPHHLVALWPVSAGSALQLWLSAPGPRAVATFAQAIGMRGVSIEHQMSDRFAAARFINVNTRNDLAVARRIAEEMDDPDRGDRRAGRDRPARGPCAG